MYVFIGVYLFILFVSKIMQKPLDRFYFIFLQNSVERWHMRRPRYHYILVVILIALRQF